MDSWRRNCVLPVSVIPCVGSLTLLSFFSLVIPVFSITLLSFFSLVIPVLPTTFVFDGFNGTNLMLQEGASLIRSHSAVALTNHTQLVVGRALYSTPVQMKSNETLSSFSTTFVFSMVNPQVLKFPLNFNFQNRIDNSPLIGKVMK